MVLLRKGYLLTFSLLFHLLHHSQSWLIQWTRSGHAPCVCLPRPVHTSVLSWTWQSSPCWTQMPQTQGLVVAVTAGESWHRVGTWSKPYPVCADVYVFICLCVLKQQGKFDCHFSYQLLHLFLLFLLFILHPDFSLPSFLLLPVPPSTLHLPLPHPLFLHFCLGKSRSSMDINKIRHIK